MAMRSGEPDSDEKIVLPQGTKLEKNRKIPPGYDSKRYERLRRKRFYDNFFVTKCTS